VKPGTKTTLVLAGGPLTADKTASGTILPLVFDPADAKAKKPSPTNPTDTCKILFANADSRGSLKVEAQSGASSGSIDLAPGQTKLVEEIPVGPFDLKVTPLFQLAGGRPALTALNAFTPSQPATYYCIFYAKKPYYPTTALFLSNDVNGDLGESIPDER